MAKHTIPLCRLQRYPIATFGHPDFETLKGHKLSFFGQRLDMSWVVSKFWLIPPLRFSFKADHLGNDFISQFVTVWDVPTYVFQIFQWIPLSSTNIINLPTVSNRTTPGGGGRSVAAFDEFAQGPGGLRQFMDGICPMVRHCRDMTLWRNRLHLSHLSITHFVKGSLVIENFQVTDDCHD